MRTPDSVTEHVLRSGGYKVHRERTRLLYLNGPFGSRRGISNPSSASKRHGPFHHPHKLLSTLVFMLVPTRPDIGRNWTSASCN